MENEAMNLSKVVLSLAKAKVRVISFLLFALAAASAYAQEGGGAILDLSGVQTAVQTEVGGAAPVIAAVLGIIIAIGVVIMILKRSR
jgi:hypothetical protein